MITEVAPFKVLTGRLLFESAEKVRALELAVERARPPLCECRVPDKNVLATPATMPCARLIFPSVPREF